MASDSQLLPSSSHWYVTDLNLSLQFHNYGLVIVATVLISILLLIIFLLFNFGCQCNQIFSINTSTSSIPLAAPANQNNKGLDEATINSLPVFLYASLTTSSCGEVAVNKESECCICLGSFEENEMVKVIPRCMHVYHSECLDKWLFKTAICPLCRANVLQLHSSSALQLISA